MSGLRIDFITSLDGYAAGPAGGAWKAPSTSPGWKTSQKRTKPS